MAYSNNFINYEYFQHSILPKIRWPPTCDNGILGVLKVTIPTRHMLKYLGEAIQCPQLTFKCFIKIKKVVYVYIYIYMHIFTHTNMHMYLHVNW